MAEGSGWERSAGHHRAFQWAQLNGITASYSAWQTLSAFSGGLRVDDEKLKGHPWTNYLFLAWTVSSDGGGRESGWEMKVTQKAWTSIWGTRPAMFSLEKEGSGAGERF